MLGATKLGPGMGQFGVQPALLQPMSRISSAADTVFPCCEIGGVNNGAIPKFNAPALANAHDLIGPLTAIALYLVASRRLLDRHAPDEFAEIRYALDKAQSQLLRAANITKQLCERRFD